MSYVWKIVTGEDLHPYHFFPVSTIIIAEDFATREQFFQQLDSNENLNHLVLYTDEATFTQYGMSNIHDEHVYVYENPHVAKQTKFQKKFGCNVWCSLIGDKLVGLCFFEDCLNGSVY